ncbi:class II aldolase/adducin family protein [Humitalea sp. 24SJ18S-53]|uniref:class II aldolase/adducin family protein n=1 Tax=Humitalea sp. 24SJ18S-53 TaxID=3422307 RepID=UPI003D670B7F
MSARRDMAALCRLMAHFGLDDITSTHLSVLVPERPGNYLLNPYGMMLAEVTPGDAVEVDADGKIVDPGNGWPLNKTAIVIHGAVHRARPEVGAAIHAHTHAGIAVGALPEGLLPISQWAMKFVERTAYHDYDGAARAGGLGEAIAQDLGANNLVMLLRNHGTLAVGDDAAGAFIRLYYLEQACKSQLMLGARGAGDLVMPPAEVRSRAGFEQNQGTLDHRRDFLAVGHREWPALLRLLDRTQPGWDA